MDIFTCDYPVVSLCNNFLKIQQEMSGNNKIFLLL